MSDIKAAVGALLAEVDAGEAMEEKSVSLEAFARSRNSENSSNGLHKA